MARSTTLTDREVAVVIDAIDNMRAQLLARLKDTPTLTLALEKINSLMTPATDGLIVTVGRFGTLTDQEIEVTQSALEEYVDGWTDENYRACCKALAAEVAAEEQHRPALVAKIAEADNFDAR